MKSRVYPNGFLFTEKKIDMFKLPDYFDSKLIFNKFYYIFDKHSKKIIFEDANKFIIIHGLFAHIDLEKGNITSESPELLLELYQINEELFLRTLDYLAGRFTIIIGDENRFEVFTDAAAMRTVYYSIEDRTIGSHVNLMNDTLNFSEDIIYNITSESIKTWDNTQFKNLKSLNPNFRYNSEKNSTLRYFPRDNNRYTDMSHEEKLGIFEFLWKEQLSGFLNIYDINIFSITGGADSRVSLALAKDYINDLRFFTYAPTADTATDESKFAQSLAKDKAIVDQILEVFPLNHQYLLFRENKIPLMKDEINILNKNTVFSHGRYLLPQYNNYFPNISTLHVRGNLFEIGRAYFIKSTSKNNKSDVYNLATSALIKSTTSPSHSQIIRNHTNDKILEFSYEKGIFDYHVLDLYYWEIRMGRWMSEILNETDFSFETLLPFNMRAIMDISLSYTLEERKNNYMFNELINNNFPVLNFFGKNNEKNLYEQQLESINSPNLTSVENKLTNNFTVFNSEHDELIKMIDATKLYIPIEYMGKENYSQSEFKFKKESGSVKLCVHNKYKNYKGKGYLKYQILVNEELLMEEDIAYWSVETDITITGLNKNDVLYVRVLSNKNSNTLSWQRASEIIIKNYEEYYSKEPLPLAIYSSSPFSVCF